MVLIGKTITPAQLLTPNKFSLSPYLALSVTYKTDRCPIVRPFWIAFFCYSGLACPDSPQHIVLPLRNEISGRRNNAISKQGKCWTGSSGAAIVMSGQSHGHVSGWISRQRAQSITYGILLTASALMSSIGAFATDLTHLSRPDDPFVFGLQGNKPTNSSDCKLSQDGQFAVISSAATQLVANDRNGVSDVFLIDRSTGSIDRVSRRSDGSESSRQSFDPAISRSGRYVTFRSAEDLMGDEDFEHFQVYLFDRSTQSIRLVSANLLNQPSNGSSYDPVFDPNENYLGFSSDATDLIPGIQNAVTDGFVYELATANIERVSVGSSGQEANDFSAISGLSAEAELVLFTSRADNLVADDVNGQIDVFVHERAPGITYRVNVDPVGGAEANKLSLPGAISDNGKVLVFPSRATNLILADGNAVSDVFALEPGAGNLSRISTDAFGTEGDGATFQVTLSSDGRYAAMRGESTNHGFANPDGVPQVFVKDLHTGNLAQLTGGDPVLFSVLDISANGRFVCFSARAGDLVADDLNQGMDTFVVDRQTGVTTLLARARTAYPTLAGDGNSQAPDISADGSAIVYQSRAAGLDSQAVETAFGVRNTSQIYLQNLDSGDIKRLSTSVFTGEAGNDFSSSPVISADGRFVVFRSRADNLVAGSPIGNNVYRVDTASAATVVLGAGEAGGGYDISGSGEFVVFASSAANVDVDDTNNRSDIFLWSPAAGVSRISIGQGAEQANNHSNQPKISSDATHVVFVSSANNLVPDDSNPSQDIFVLDLSTGILEIVSVDVAGVAAGGPSFNPDISGDGRFVVFSSAANNLVPGDIDAGVDLFFVDRQSGVITRITETLAALGLVAPENPKISHDGENVVFLATDANGYATLLRYRQDTGELQLLIAGDPQGETDVRPPGSWAVSENGAHIVTDWIDRLADTDVNDPRDDRDIYRIDLHFGELTVSPTSHHVSEDSSSVSIEVNRLGGSDGLVRLRYATADDTATEGEDYVPASGTLEWPDGDNSAQFIVVDINDDDELEATQSFTVVLSDVAGGAQLLTQHVVVSIIDNDSEELPIFSNGFESDQAASHWEN